MHSKHVDLARTAACWRDDAANDNAPHPFLLALVAAIPFLAFVGMLAAIALRWLA